MMDGLYFLMENLRPLSPLLGYAVIRVVKVATSPWTWVGLVLIIFISLWGFRGIKGFQIGFSWWGKQAKVRVMLPSFSSAYSSNHSAGRNNNTAFGRNMCMDDLHVFTYRGEGLTERGICTRRSTNRSKSSSTIDSLTLCSSAEGMDNCIEAVSARFLHTKMMFIIEKSSSLSVAKSVPFPLRIGEKELESPTSDQQLDCPPGSLIRLPMHEMLRPAQEFWGNECRSIEEPMKDCRGKITFSPDFLYDVKCKEKCKGSSFVMNDGEGGEQLGKCLLDNPVHLGVWRRLASFEIQSGWDRLQSLRLGYALNWNRCTWRSGLNLDKFSKYLVPDIDVGKVLNSPNRSLVKLFSLQEDVVSSVDIVWNMGLSSTCTVSDNRTVRQWDIEVGKCVNKTVVDDYVILGCHVENCPDFLLSSIMVREEKASLLVWDPRDFLKPLNFSVGNMLTFHSVQLHDTKVCVSDCFNERLFDLRMMVGSPPD